VKGRKRHILVDVMGLLLAVCVHSAGTQDRDGARLLAESVPPNLLPALRTIWADQGYTGPLAAWLRETRGWHVEVVRHPDGSSGGTGTTSARRTRSGYSRGGGSWSVRSPGWARAAG
jgi:putative transposase